MPIKFKKNFINLSRDEFIKIINFEGAKFYKGYVKPLYLQPLYQKKNCLNLVIHFLQKKT